MEYKIFVIQITVFNISFDIDNKIHLSKKAQIAYLKTTKISIKVPSKYANFANIFLSKLTVELSKYMDINNYTIKLINDWQSP